MTVLVAFVLGLVVGSVLSATALMLAIGTTSSDLPALPTVEDRTEGQADE